MNECCLFCVHYVNNKCALPALLCLDYDRFKAVPIVTIRRDDLETKYISRQYFDEMKARAEVAEASLEKFKAISEKLYSALMSRIDCYGLESEAWDIAEDYRNLRETMTVPAIERLREKYGKHFDDIDPDQYIRDLRDDESEDK